MPMAAYEFDASCLRLSYKINSREGDRVPALPNEAACVFFL
jgi:hypothetical protein